MTAISAPRLGYIPQLDGVRAVAITFVVAYHLGVPFSWGGFLGVDVFFVLSGFLITSILWSELALSGRLQLGRFWLRRLLRLYPAVIVAATVMLISSPFTARPGDGPYWVSWIAALTYTSNLFISLGHANLGTLDPTWSLALEEQFYLVWPVLLHTCVRTLRLGRGVLVATIVALSFVSFLLGALLFVDRIGNGTPYSYYRPDTRAGELFIGCALALGYSTFGGRRLAVRLGRFLGYAGFLCLLALVVLMPHNWPHLRWVFAVMLPVAGISAGAFVIGVTARETWLTSFLSFSAVRWLGQISYSLYLWHFATFRFVLGCIEGVSGKAVALTIAIALAAATYYLIERPFLRLKSRLDFSASSKRGVA